MPNVLSVPFSRTRRIITKYNIKVPERNLTNWQNLSNVASGGIGRSTCVVWLPVQSDSCSSVHAISTPEQLQPIRQISFKVIILTTLFVCPLTQFSANLIG